MSACASALGQTYKSQIENPIVRYRISARLDAGTKTVKGRYELIWRNHTADFIPDLYFHLYLNAFKNLDSTFMREQVVSRRQDLLKSWKARPEQDKWGWVDIERLQLMNGPDLTSSGTFVHPDDDNTQDQTVWRVVLPQPVPPFGMIGLSVEFTSKLPRALARTGYAGDYFLVAQWFPKIGVYEGAGERSRAQGGWNCHQFHANTEFYADFGVYDVELTVPSNFVVGATGFLRDERRNADGTTTYHFYQEDVHDFVWTASPHFLKLTRTFDWGRVVRADEMVVWTKVLNLPAERLALQDVSVTLLLHPDHRGLVERYFHAAFQALKYYGLWYGKYPYDTLTIVDPPRNSNTGGMEYPTLITGGAEFWPGERSSDPEEVTIHEFGHQYWYGMIGNNEFEEAFLDEGLNTYSTGKVLEVAYGHPCHYERFLGIPFPLGAWLNVRLPPFPFAGIPRLPVGAYLSCVERPDTTKRRARYLWDAKDDNLVREGWKYLKGESYTVNSYDRVALTLRTLQNYLGAETMARALRAYADRWRFRHPSVKDFIQTVEEVSGQKLGWFFEQFFFGSNLVDYAVTDILNVPLEGKVGVYDEDRKKVTYLEEPARQAFEKSAEKRYRSTVVVRRLGEVTAPVDIVIQFENGETVREHWDGSYRWAKFTYEKAAKVGSAVVDPARKLVLDANYTNNSLLAEVNNRAAAKWYVRWIFWLANLFFAASFFS
jgi:hypothetical protein